MHPYLPCQLKNSPVLGIDYLDHYDWKLQYEISNFKKLRICLKNGIQNRTNFYNNYEYVCYLFIFKEIVQFNNKFHQSNFKICFSCIPNVQCSNSIITLTPLRSLVVSARRQEAQAPVFQALSWRRGYDKNASSEMTGCRCQLPFFFPSRTNQNCSLVS